MSVKNLKKIIFVSLVFGFAIFVGTYFIWNGKSAFDALSGIYHKLSLDFFNQQACAQSAGSGCGVGAGGDGAVYDAGQLSCSYLLTWQPDKYNYQKGDNITIDYNIENVTYTQDVYCDAVTGACTYGPMYPLPDCNLIGNWARPFMDPANVTATDKYKDWATSSVSYCGEVRCNSYESSGGQMTRLLPDSYSDGMTTAGLQKIHLHWKPGAWYNQPQGAEYDLRVTDAKDIYINFPPVLSGLSTNTDNFCSGNAVNFSWNFFDPDGGSQSGYWLSIDDEPNFFSPTIVQTAELTANTFYTWTGGEKNKTYYWKVGVRDDENTFSGYSYGSSFSVLDSVCNRPPIANAGLDQTVNEGAVITLDGSGSSDPDGDPLSFSWTGPIALSGANTNKPTSAAPQVDSTTTYAFILTVNDGRGGSASDSVNIIVKDIGPPPPPPKDGNKPPSATDLSVNTFSKTYNLCQSDKPEVIFSWVFSDPDAGDSQTAYQVQADNDSNFSSPAFESGKVTGINGTSKSSSGSLPGFDVDYYWRVMVWDSKGAASKWYPGSSFRTPKHDYPSVAFEPNKAVTNQPVQFQDKSQVFGGTTISDRSWTFQDATPTSSTAQNPSVTFLSPGTAKSVTLQVTDSSGFSCKIQEAVDVGLPLPGFIEIPPY